MFTNLSIKWKLGATIGVVCVLLMLAIATALNGMQKLGGRFQNFLEIECAGKLLDEVVPTIGKTSDLVVHRGVDLSDRDRGGFERAVFWNKLSPVAKAKQVISRAMSPAVNEQFCAILT